MKAGIDATVDAVLAQQDMEETRSYLARGRRLAALGIEELEREWIAAFAAVCADGDRSRWTDLADLGAELGLRQRNKPLHLVRPGVMAIVQQRVRESWQEGRGPVGEAVGRILDEMEKPKN